MEQPKHGLSTIPAGVPFAEFFAAKLLQQYKENPEKLAEILVLLPTRRACRIVQDSFLRQSGGTALLLPRLQTIGDVDDQALGMEMAALALPGTTIQTIPPAMPLLQRRVILAGLILKWPAYAGQPDQALALADALGQLLDRVHTEGLDMTAITALVDDSALAERWQMTLEFLDIILKNWPAILAERGMIDAADRRNRLLLALADHWSTHPPTYPVYAAGSTGSIPAAGRLLGVIARMEQGFVVLPGLDTTIDPASWEGVDDTHPQATLKKLLQQLNTMPWDVPLWDPAATPPPRSILAQEIMRPAATSTAWQNLARHPKKVTAGLAQLQQINCQSAEEEASLIALIFRHVQHQPGKTAALVTFDRGLARRVAGACARWGLRIDDSAGQFLNTTQIGSYLEFCVETCVQDLAPIPLLSLLKHTHSAAGLVPGDFRGSVRRLDRSLRGLRPAPGIAGLRAHCPENTPLIDGLEHSLAPLISLCDGKTHPFSAFLRAHIEAAEHMAQNPEQSGATRLWSGEDGEAAATLMAELITQGGGLPEVDGRQYIRMLNTLMRGVQVRPRWGTHPRLALLGPMEARMLQADLVIMGGLNEGSWPGIPDPDPWMSRPMAQKFGLPSPERGTGLSAHDFVHAFCANEVIMTRSVRTGTAPTIPSRWLQRLETVLAAAGASLTQTDWLEKTRALDRPQENISPALRPKPAPPIEKRPVRLSVTEIETWMRDPYSVYAKHVLKLYQLDSPDESLGAADRGTVLHAILEQFVRTYKDSLPDDAEEKLLAMGNTLLDHHIKDVRTRHFWGVRLENITKWFISHERTWRMIARPLLLEAKGEMALPDTPFVLSGKADRIDRILGGAAEGDTTSGPGCVAIIDYKTGATPKARDIALGLSPQLPLEAAMVRAGAFPGLPAGTDVGALTHWVVSGNRAGGKLADIKQDPEDLADQALQGLTRLVQTFANPATPYMSLPRPAARPRYSDYTQLARVQEWAVLDDSADGGE